jgi:hypothetical protein
MIAIFAVFVSSLLQCDWATGTLHDHAKKLNEQHQVLAGAL